MGIRRHLVPLALVVCLALAACSDDTTTVTVDPGVDPQGTAPEAGEAPSGEDEDPAASTREWSAEMADRGGIVHADPQGILEAAEGLTSVDRPPLHRASR